MTTYRDGRAGRDRAVGIAGFEPEHLKHFSKRSREIEKALQAQGLKSRLHGSRVTVATRAVKPKGIDREALLWKWRTTAREIGLQFPKWERERLVMPGRLAPARELELSTRVAVNGAVAHLSERRAVFRLAQLEKEALSRGRDRGGGSPAALCGRVCLHAARRFGPRGGKEAARLNVSALVLGQARIVPTERDWNDPQVRDAIVRGGGEDLGEIRHAISRLSRGAGPVREPLRLPRVRDVGPER